MTGKGQASAKPVTGDAAVLAGTGHDWSYWFKTLDKAGAARLDHKGIVAILHGKMKLGPWWGQMIAVSYERSRGLRAANQKCDGKFSVSVTKVLPVSLPKLYSLATSRREAWFPKGSFEETSRTKDKYWRGKWRKSGRLEIGFYAKGEGKAQIALQSNKLSGPDAVETERAAWKKAMDRLAGFVEA